MDVNDGIFTEATTDRKVKSAVKGVRKVGLTGKFSNGAILTERLATDMTGYSWNHSSVNICKDSFRLLNEGPLVHFPQNSSRYVTGKLSHTHGMGPKSSINFTSLRVP